MQTITLFLLPLFLLLSILLSLLKKRNTYEVFSKGILEGLALFKDMLPSLISMYFAVNLLSSCGFLSDIRNFLSQIFVNGKTISDVVPIFFMRPISGSGSLAFLEEVCKSGGDTFSCKLGSAIEGASDTTLYVLSLYFSSVKITKWKHSLTVGLIADLVGMSVAIILSIIFLK